MKFPSEFFFTKVSQRIAIAAFVTLSSCSGSSDDDPAPEAAPQVNSISPTSGLNTIPVNIIGTNFSSTISENTVTFNGVLAVITTATPTQLTATVPISAVTGPVVVKVKDKTASNKPVFTVESPSPEVNKISPTFGLTNTPVAITGVNFSLVLNENKVTFNGKDAVVTAATATQLTVTVPLLSETGPVVVTVKGKTAVGQPVFTVLVVPVVSTAAVTDIILTTAISGGTITSEGGSAVISRGICWSTSPSPTTLGNKTVNGTGGGSYTSSLTGITLGLTYYVRAYATNNFGTAYGNEVTFKSLPILGAEYQGGIIAYIFQPGDPGYIDGESHGLIASPEDQGSKLEWRNNAVNTVTGATGTALGAGKTNTVTIVGSTGGPYTAASSCFNLSKGIYEDWYLPSKDELNKLYIARAVIGNFSTSDYYWTSTEANADAWIQSFITGVQSTYSKLGDFRVRAIRYF
jgi:hypothetical protein